MAFPEGAGGQAELGDGAGDEEPELGGGDDEEAPACGAGGVATFCHACRAPAQRFAAEGLGAIRALCEVGACDLLDERLLQYDLLGLLRRLRYLHERARGKALLGKRTRL